METSHVGGVPRENINKVFLHWCYTGQTKNVKMFVKTVGEVVNDVVNVHDEDGNTPLIIASGQGYLEIVEFLIASGADLNQTSTDNGGHPPGHTALIMSSRNGHLKVVKALIAAGADVNAENYSGATALIITAQLGYLEIVKVLIASGADVNQCDKILYGEPLYNACKNGHLEIVKLLVAKGCRVNHANYYRQTPLHAACQCNQVNVAKFLIASGASVNAIDCNKCSALHTCSGAGHLKVAKVLIQANANIHLRTKDKLVEPYRPDHFKTNATAYDLALDKGRHNVVNFLLDHDKWNHIKPLYLMRPWDDHKKNKAHRPTILGAFLVDKDDREKDYIKEIIASFLWNGMTIEKKRKKR